MTESTGRRGRLGLPIGGLAGLIALGLGLSLFSCGGPAQALLPPDWESWQRTTKLRLDYPIPGHENRLRVPRMNALGFASLPKQPPAAKAWDFPEGTIIAKDIYASANPKPGEGPVAVTAMLKAPEDPRARGGWIWFNKDLASGQERVFTEEFCVTCHENANETHPYGDKNPKGEFRDYVFLVPLGSGSPSPAGAPDTVPQPSSPAAETYGSTP